MFASVEHPPFRIAIGSAAGMGVPIAVPVVAGDAIEHLFAQAEDAGRAGAFSLFRDGFWHIGLATRPAVDDLEAIARSLYAELLAVNRGRHLVRIWNYVPGINAQDSRGLEYYQAFCRGRSLAFEQAFGPDFTRHAPAASATGCDRGNLTVVFAAHTNAPHHHENPRQVPAYEYPAAYGPRPPTFARATVVQDSTSRVTFIAGTSAIIGHATIAAGDTRKQLSCTLDNLREIGRASGLGVDLAASQASRRYFKVYLRHAADHPEVAATLDRQLLQPTDRVSYLRADICRQPLNIEIEATISVPA